MDRQVVDQKLESLRRCLKRLTKKCPSEPSILIADIDLQDIIALNLSRAVQVSVDIGAHLIADLEIPTPNTMGETFDLLAQEGILNYDLATNLKKAVGFRNIAVHNYETINWHIVFSIITNHLDDFNEFAKRISTQLEASKP